MKFIAGGILIVLTAMAFFLFQSNKTIQDLLMENKKLRAAIVRLTTEEQIGYAKVIAQEEREGRLFTRLRFVETARDNTSERILERVYEIQGDVVHFDAMRVKFDPTLVQDGSERSLFLWRRVYGDYMPPSEGYLIEEPGQAPERYRELFEPLGRQVNGTFWEAIWDLSNNPAKLSKHGIQAINGTVVYQQLRPGLIYVFKVGAMGQLFAETVPEM